MYPDSLKHNNVIRTLAKDPIALLLAEWLANRFNMDVIVLIRHPVAFASSLKRLNWHFDSNNLLKQPMLMDDSCIHLKGK